MTEDEYWTLIEASRRDAGGQQASQIEKFIDRLEQCTEEEIVSFMCHTHLQMNRPNDCGLGTAFSIVYRDYAFSDDLFLDFRAALVLQGRDAVAAALVQPDQIDAENLDATEYFVGCPGKAWLRKNPGRKRSEFMPNLAELTGEKYKFEASGDRIELTEDLGKSKYPRLWARYATNPKKPPGC